MSLLGAVPFMLALDAELSRTRSSSRSRATRRRASTVLVGLDAMSPSILFYRQEIQWLGGIGVIVLAVALLPMLGIGGMQLYKAETAGPFKDERLTPRITRTARNVCVVYVLLTAVCAVALLARRHDRCSTRSATASSRSRRPVTRTHDASIAFFDSVPIEVVATVFTLIGGISFNEHFIAWRTLQLHRYGRDTQTRVFLLLIVLVAHRRRDAGALCVHGTYGRRWRGAALRRCSRS